MKESDDRATKLNRNYEQELQILIAKANNLKSTCEHIVRQRQQEAQTTREELEIFRAQIGMDETRIKTLIAKHRQRFNIKIEEALARAWQDWLAQAAELQVLCADSENRRKEGRGFYKMDENCIQLLRKDLTEEFQALAKSHTVEIEQL